MHTKRGGQYMVWSAVSAEAIVARMAGGKLSSSLHEAQARMMAEAKIDFATNCDVTTSRKTNEV